jgi:hypothetical protein
MRRVAKLVLFAVVLSACGCLTPEAKKQWNSAFGDLNGNNTKDIAPLSSKKPQ